jgi:hypothetical protein
MRTRSFSARLAALEELEQQAEAQVIEVEAPPDLALMDDAEAFWWAVWRMRQRYMTAELSAPLGPVRFATRLWGRQDVWWHFDTALTARATALMEQLPKPILFLDTWEIAQAIAAIDAGLARLAWSGYDNSRGMQVMCDYRLWPRTQALLDDQDARTDLQLTCDAVNTALELLNRQQHYPQPRDFSQPEMTTLAEWRAWLVSLGEQRT